MNLKFLLDSTDYGEPLDWDSTSITLEAERDLNSRFLKYEFPATWQGAAYDYIVGVFDADYTDTIDFEIQYRCTKLGTFASVYKGTIRARDCEINRHLKLVRVETAEKGLQALIKSNKGVKAYVDVDRSKNDTAITGVTATAVSFYNPATYPVSYSANRDCFYLYDVFSYLVDFMSDGAVSFDSELLKSNGHWETNYGSRLFITTGSELRNSADKLPPEVSFADLFDAVNKLMGIGIYVDNDTQTIYIEALDESVGSTDAIYSTSASTTVTQRNVKHLTEYIDTARLYATVKIGSDTTQRTESGTFQWPDYRFFNFKEEVYNFAGQHNNESELDLVNKYVLDSNVIEDVFVNNVDDYDDDLFFVEVDLLAARATDFDLFNAGGAPLVYNANLTNQEVLPRHVGGVPADATLYLGSTTDDFQAQKTGTTSSAGGVITLNPADYNDDTNPPNFDTGGNYDAVTNYDYTAPADGHYQFNATLLLTNIVLGFNSQIDVTLELRRTDAVPATTAIATKTYSGVTSQTTLDITGWTYMDQNDTMEVYCQIIDNGPGPVASFDVTDGTFMTVNQSNGGGIYGEFDQNDARINMYRWDKEMAFSDFQNIISDPRGRIRFNCGDNDNNDLYGWIEKAEYKLGTGKANMIIRTSKNDETQ